MKKKIIVGVISALGLGGAAAAVKALIRRKKNAQNTASGGTHSV